MDPQYLRIKSAQDLQELVGKKVVANVDDEEEFEVYIQDFNNIEDYEDNWLHEICSVGISTVDNKYSQIVLTVFHGTKLWLKDRETNKRHRVLLSYPNE